MIGYSLKRSEWPDADRQMWDGITTRTGLLDDGGACAHWAAETKRVAARDYGYWLQYLLATEPQVLAETPADRVTSERVRGYCQSMGKVCHRTMASRIARLLAVVRAGESTRDWRWLVKLRAALERAARREGLIRPKHGRVRSSAQLFDAGLAKLTAADQMVGLRPIVQAERFRDGLMIALLASRPLRIKNFASLQLGDHLREASNGFVLEVPGVETKTGRPINTYIPEVLVSHMRRYLHHYRPFLLGGKSSKHVWMTRVGTSFLPSALSIRIAEQTTKLVGARVNPHLFRDCAATTIATDDPAHVMTIAPILGHSSLKTAEKHYNQARTLEASRRYQHSIGELRKRARPLRRRGSSRPVTH